MVEGGATGPAGGVGGGVWAKARPAARLAAATPAAPTSARRDSVAAPLSSNRFDELMSVTPNGFRCVNFIKTLKNADAYLKPQATLLAILLPPRRGGIVAFVRADPFLAGRRFLELPESRLGLEP